MEIYQIKVFIEVARHLSFTEAADALNLTQPAVSAKIKALETSLGTNLFHRLGRKITLTTVGEYLLRSGPDLIALENRLIQEIDAIKQGKLSRLVIGSTASILDGWLPEIIFNFRNKYPNVELKCLSFNTLQDLHQSITCGHTDLGFSDANLDDFEEIVSVPVDQFQYSLVVAADHRLARAQWLSIKDLASELWVFPALDTPERVLLETRLAELGMKLSDFPHHEVAQTANVMSTFLQQGHYLGFASSLQFQTEQKAKLLVSIPLQEFTLGSRLFLLMSKSVSKQLLAGKKKAKSDSRQALKKFIDMVERRNLAMQSGRVNSGDAPSTDSAIASPQSTSPQSNLRSTSALPKPTYLNPPKINGPRSYREPEETITLTIGTQHKTIQTVTAGLIIERLGLLEHFLPREGRYRSTQYRVKWCNFTSGAPIVSGLQSQQLDIGILGDYPLLLSGSYREPTSIQLDGTKFRKAKASMSNGEADMPLAKTRLVSFVASNPDGSGNTIIVPNHSPLNSLDDLRDRTIAVPFSSSAHGMVIRRLARENLLDKVTLTSIDKLNINQLTPRTSKVDGYAYFAPLPEIANANGRFRRLIGDDNITELPTFHGIVVHETLADRHPDIVVAYLKALLAAQHWYSSTPNAVSLVSEWVRLDTEIVANTLDFTGSNTTGLFFHETTIRSDWIVEHIRQLKSIKGNQNLGEININSWIQADFLEAAIHSF
ncbi:MAG: LysR substrate-binding domain-containing protein [Cyanobacteria bacterium P01_F01_bin.150]